MSSEYSEIFAILIFLIIVIWIIVKELQWERTSEETPVREKSVRETPVRETPVRETPVRETPVRETPVRETLVRETPRTQNVPPLETIYFNDLEKVEEKYVGESVTVDMIYERMAQAMQTRNVPVNVSRGKIVVSSGLFGPKSEPIPCIKITPTEKKDAYMSFAISAVEQYGNTFITFYTVGKSALEYLRGTKDGNNIYVRNPRYIMQWEEEIRFYQVIGQSFKSMFE